MASLDSREQKVIINIAIKMVLFTKATLSICDEVPD